MQKVKEPEGEANGYDMEPWRSAQPEVQPGVQPGMQPGLQLQPPAAYYTGGDPITPTGSGVPPQNARQFV